MFWKVARGRYEISLRKLLVELRTVEQVSEPLGHGRILVGHSLVL